MQEILTSICFLRLQMVTCPFSLVAASHKLQIHVKSVRVLTIKRSQWARKNFAVIVKSDLWKKNNNFAKDAKILRPSQSIRKQFGQVVEKSFVCHFVFFSFRESNDWDSISGVRSKRFGKELPPCQCRYVNQNFFLRTRKGLGTS